MLKCTSYLKSYYIFQDNYIMIYILKNKTVLFMLRDMVLFSFSPALTFVPPEASLLKFFQQINNQQIKHIQTQTHPNTYCFFFFLLESKRTYWYFFFFFLIVTYWYLYIALHVFFHWSVLDLGIKLGGFYCIISYLEICKTPFVANMIVMY